jgi:hypothetical protein
MNDQESLSPGFPNHVFQDGAIYLLLAENDMNWIERPRDEFYIIKDHADLAAAIQLELTRYGYILQGPGSFKLEPTAHPGFWVHVEHKEELFPEETGTITFWLFPAKSAKEFLAEP